MKLNIKYISYTLILIIYIIALFQFSFPQKTFEIKTVVNKNIDLLPKTAVPITTVEFVGRHKVNIKNSPNFQSKTPFYGIITIGNSIDHQNFVIVLDENTFDEPRVYIDANNNGNLFDDGEPFWTDKKEGILSKEISLDVVFVEDGIKKKQALPYKISRFENPVTRQIRVILQPAFLRTGELELGKKTYKILAQTYNKKGLFSDKNDITLGIDRDSDGLIDISLLSGEIFWGGVGGGGGQPFNIDGETFYIKNTSASGDFISLAVSDKKVAPKNYISVGKKAPSFSFKDLNGKKIDFKTLENKVILLDFWATWCRPCVSNLPKLKKLSETFSSSNFAILGISLDGGKTNEKKIQKMKDFVDKQKLIWTTSFENLGMESKIGKLYNVVDIPLYIIVDKKGVIQLIVRGSDSAKLKIIEDKVKFLLKQ